MTPTARIYWDSCVIIDYIQKKAGRIATLQEIIDEARAGDIQLVSSALSRAEVYKLDKEDPLSSQEEKHIDSFFENTYIHIRDLDRFVAKHAADIARTHSLLPPDAIHIATAIKYKCTALQTYDGSGRRSRRKHLLTHNGTIGTPPLTIEEPRTYTKMAEETRRLPGF